MIAHPLIGRPSLPVARNVDIGRCGAKPSTILRHVRGTVVQNKLPTDQIQLGYTSSSCFSYVLRHQHSKRHQWQLVRSSAAAFADPADVIPDAYEDDDDEQVKVDPANQTVVIVGCGPAGVLASMYLARRGFNVEVFEKNQEPAGNSGRPSSHNYPIVLSTRALLAFKELKLHTSFTGVNAPIHRGDYDMVAKVRQRVDSGNIHKRTTIVDHQGLVSELVSEAKRIYPTKVRFHFGTELRGVNFEGRTATFEARLSALPFQPAMLKQVHQAGSMAAAMDRSSPGNALHVSIDRNSSPDSAASSSAISGSASDDRGDVVNATSSSSSSGSGSTIEVPYNLLVGADGANSRVRECMVRARPKIRDFEVQQPMIDGNSFKGFQGLPQRPSSGFGASSTGSVASELVPGFTAHAPREYLYYYKAPSAPSITCWIPQEGKVSGIISGVDIWDAGTLTQQLRAAYKGRLPEPWLESIVAQTCGPDSLPASSFGRNVQCSQFHGPRTVLLGDAAHAMTNELGEGLNCAIESVRLFNVVLKLTSDSLDKAPLVFSDARGEDAHCMQMIEQMKRSMQPKVVYGDAMFAISGALSKIVWRMAALTLMILQKLMPDRFSQRWAVDRLRDSRVGYNEVLKALTRFAAVPIIALLGVVAMMMRGPLAALFKPV